MKWFDLARFGAKLTVLPKSEARSKTVLRLEMKDSKKWVEQLESFKKENPDAEKLFSQEKFNDSLKKLGFGEMKSRSLVTTTKEDFDKHGFSYVRFVSESVRGSLKLSEIQTLMPGFKASEVVDLPLNKVIVSTEDFLAQRADWEKVRPAMAFDGASAWVAVKNPWDQPGGIPVTIKEAMKEASIWGGADDGVNKTITLSAALQADQLGYRSDALVTYYVSEDAAKADGLIEGEYKKSDLEGMLPIRVTGDGKVVALRNLWDMPDFLDTMPVADALRIDLDEKAPKSLVAAYLRERIDLKARISTALNTLEKWVEKPDLIKNESPDLLWGQLSLLAEGINFKNSRYGLNDSTFEGVSTACRYVNQNESRLAPLNELHDGNWQTLARCIHRLEIQPEEKALELMNSVRDLWKKMHVAQITAQAKEARELAKKARELENPKPSSEEKDSRKHVDAGEKIGGARKDFAKRSLDVLDVEAMNDTEVSLHVTKSNVWPALNYSSMKESGVDVSVAMGLKLIKDSINTKPSKLAAAGSGRESAQKYVEYVGTLRELFDGVKTQDDLMEAVRKSSQILNDLNPAIKARSFSMQVGKDFSNLVDNKYRSVLSVADSKIKKATRIWNSETQRIEYDDPWKSLIKASKVATEEQISERKKKADIDRELHIPHLASVQRTGEDWRGGRDITADDLIETFGFRGVEYGEWLPQKERQEVINFAFDSFSDLAQSLNLKPKDISLGEELAIAFGSRGTGGKGAALAHFEPARMVINMTRMKGAGALAHEWFHALDRRLALNSSKGDLYASESAVKNSAMFDLVERMHFKNADPNVLLQEAQERAARSRKNAHSWLTGLPAEKQKIMKDGLDEAFDNICNQIKKTVDSFLTEKTNNQPSYSNGGIINPGLRHSLSTDLCKQMKEKWAKSFTSQISKNIEGNAWHFAKYEGLAQTIEGFKRHGMDAPDELLGHVDLRTISQFSDDASKLDKLRSSPYWNTTRELFARAGAAFVQDKITDLGNRSDYLVHGSQEGRVVPGIDASPNPRGDDRVALSACFDALMNEYRATLSLTADAPSP